MHIPDSRLENANSAEMNGQEGALIKAQSESVSGQKYANNIFSLLSSS